MGIYIKIFFILFLVLNTEARPISYSGGHTLMHFNDNMKESIYYHYSPSFKYSIGVEELNNKIFDRSETNLRFTYLVNRKNTKNSQRNFYFSPQLLQKTVILFMVFVVTGKLDVILLDLTIKKLKT